MTPQNLDLRHLATLRALKMAGNLTRAAALLNLTQSALSHQIKLLEESYGTVIFERKTTPLILTPAGERLVRLAQDVLPLIDAASRDIQNLVRGQSGQLRIAVECHTCFDWLMPVLFQFRPRWPEVELDFVSGFHTHPTQLLIQDKADLAILGDNPIEQGIAYQALFQCQIVGVLAGDHPLATKAFLEANDFKDQTLLTYPVPDRMLDLVQQVLLPAGINPPRRTSELTNAILQLVASHRGIAALPIWTVHSYKDHHGLALKPITKLGLKGRLYAAMREDDQTKSAYQDFISIIREVSFLTLPEIERLD